MDKKRYPANWNEISRRIRFERAQNRCEWCGAPNGAYIVRPFPGEATWRLANEGDLTEGLERKAVKIILTVHHIGIDKPDGSPGDMHDKMDCRDENLAALCQRCHLRADLPGHMANAKATRQRKKLEQIESSGQMPLF